MNVADLQLTTSQEELLPKMEAFLNGPERFFLLTGKPGVGKTFILQYLLKEHIAADKNTKKLNEINVAGICLAHQAKNVLGEHIPNVFTFAAAYGMKEVIDEVTGRRTFEFDRYAEKQLVGQMNIPVFVHDEVSQYTQEMIDIILDKTPIFSKIILVGDKAQLPPIDPDNKMGVDADSPIFDYDIPDTCKHELTERVRQAEGNPILELSDIIREEIFGGQSIKRVLEHIRVSNMIDGIGYDFVRYDDLLEHISGKDILKTRLLAYRNVTIRKFNPIVRNFMMNDPEDMIIEGDVVTMDDNYYHFTEGSPYPDYVLFNSDTFRLEKVYTSVVRYDTSIKMYRFDSYIANIEGREGQFITPTESSWEEFQDALKEIAELCKSRKLRWEEFWNLKKKFCQFSYGYASSVYKAQGSTYNTIYVDINDILLCKPITPKRKLQAIYTAITRAREDVYFLKS